ncbi:MAG TPA: hypothetical protein VIK22_02210 [Candidatus Anoxymicrobiaceae bacterium]
MKSKVLVVLVTAILATTVVGVAALAQGPATPPGQPAWGYGSPQRYICTNYERVVSGSYWDGTAVNVFIPKRLKFGRKAPVVIFLHGFLMVFPEYYMEAIEHMVKQGYIVIFPQINQISPALIMGDMDQNVFLKRAIDNANRGLAIAGSRADTGNMVAFGHSLGGLMSVCWNGGGGPRVREIVSANLATDSLKGIPDFVKQFIKITQIDWRSYAAKVDVPVMVLTGDQDTISGVSQSTDLYNALTRPPSRVLYCLQTDDHGWPRLIGDHNASMCRFIPFLGWLLNFAGGDPEVDATDYRFYWAALDAAMLGKTSLSFQMGRWSDNVPVKPILQLAP